MMKKWGLLFVLFVLTLVIAACGDEESSGGTGDSGSTSADVIKIGSLHPLSGGLALEGQEMPTEHPAFLIF